MRLTVPTLGDEELEAVRAVLESGYLTQGARCREFEGLVAARVGVSHAAACSSATTGLHLALHTLGVGRGDEGVVPAFSFPATANVVVQTGATPVFADVDPVTFAMTADSMRAVATTNTRVVMPVHPFGTCADMPAIVEAATELSVLVVEDAACALGSELGGKPAGTFGDLAVFSFHPRKVITTGEGGMIVTNNPELAEQLSVLRAHGGKRGQLPYPSFVDAGFNYRLSDLHAAIGIVQMARLDWIIEQRRRLAATYDQALTTTDGIRVGRTSFTPGRHSSHTW